MRHYPVFLDLRGKRCLVAGAGAVGRRKTATLLGCDPARVLLVDPGKPHKELEALMGHPSLVFANREFLDQDLDGVFLAVAATADPAVNQRMGELCRERRILCNVIDAPESGDFIVPAHVDLGGLVAAISTSGSSPALARVLRRDLQEYLGSRYTGLLALMDRLRPLVLCAGEDSADNAALFRSLVESPLAAALAAKDGKRARDLLGRLLPPQLRTRVDELLHGLV